MGVSNGHSKLCVRLIAEFAREYVTNRAISPLDLPDKFVIVYEVVKLIDNGLECSEARVEIFI